MPSSMALALGTFLAVVLSGATAQTSSVLATANFGFSGWTFNGGSVNAPLELVKGATYTFNVAAVSS